MDALSCRRQSFRQVWDISAVGCMRNANKCRKIPYSALVKKMKKDSDHQQKSITSRSSPLAHACQTSISTFVIYPVYKMKDGIRIWIFALIWIRMSDGSIPKCCGCIILSALVISPSMVQIGR